MRKVLLFTLGLVFVVSGSSFAFHDGGVADCGGCHTMHNSENGQLVDPDSPNGNPWLLIDATPSDVCLSCHATNHGAVLAADPLVPGAEYGGGDFVFLTEDNLNDGHAGATNPILGEAAGHNIVAPGYGIAADGTLLSAPGGAFPSSALGCSSCHDPHGNTNFRLLYGAAQVQDGLYTFTNAAPVVAAASFRGAGETNANHSGYQSGMSAWCGNCHGDFHANPEGKLIHPSNHALGGTIATAYGLYNGTEAITGGTPATSYLAAVPFEDASMTISSTAAPTASSKVMCLTCHRAHATSAPNAGRWDFNVTLLEEDGVESASFAIPDPYTSANQRSLCNKCHVKDVGDRITP